MDARLLWLGRPSNTGCKVGTWEDKINEAVEDSLSQEHKFLKALEEKLGSSLKLLDDIVTNKKAHLPDDIGLHWVNLCSNLGPASPPDFEQFAAEELANYMETLLQAKSTLEAHLAYLFHHVMMRREELVEEHVKSASLIISTADAWAKMLAGESKGVARQVVQKLQMKAMLVEEFQAYELLQAMAVSIGIGTLIFSGDIHQDFKTQLFPRWTRSPWVSEECLPGSRKRAAPSAPHDEQPERAGRPGTFPGA